MESSTLVSLFTSLCQVPSPLRNPQFFSRLGFLNRQQFDAGGADPVPHWFPLATILEWIPDRISLERKERVSRYIAICPGHLRMNMKNVSSPANPAWPTTINYIFVLGTCGFGSRSQQRLGGGGPSGDTRSLRGGCLYLLWHLPRWFCITPGSYGAGSALSGQ